VSLLETFSLTRGICQRIQRKPEASQDDESVWMRGTRKRYLMLEAFANEDVPGKDLSPTCNILCAVNYSRHAR